MTPILESQGDVVDTSDQVFQRDVIADYLLHFFIQGIACDKPKALPDDPILVELAQPFISRHSFEQQAPSAQQSFVSKAARYLSRIIVPGVQHSADVMDELSVKLGEVYKRESQTLRPFLDIHIDRGFYTDPNTLTQTGVPMNKRDTERAWQQEYQGNAHETLLQNIKSSYKRTAYANSGAIIQSSGYGKSRTVDQMATLIPTIPMNVRSKDEEQQGSFPPADAALIDIFDTVMKSSNPVQTLFVFFELLFELVSDLAKDFGGDDFTAALYHYFEDHNKRAKLYANLLKRLEQNLPNATGATEEPNTTGVTKSFMNLDKLLAEGKSVKTEEHQVRMIIYIDAAHTLASKTYNEISMYDYVLKATAELSALPIFFLFLSTASRLEMSARQSSFFISARFKAARTHLLAPFTEMPFDCHPLLAKEPIRSGMKLQDIQQFSFVVRFGRPLFWAYYEAMIENAKDPAAISHPATIALAQAKLVASNSRSVTLLGATSKLAILDTLLNLEYDSQMSHSHRLTSGMVARHLRTVYSVPVSRAYMHTGYPSEPVLAEAALDFIDQFSPTPTLGPLLSLFRDLDHSTSAAIVRGKRGENVGKMLLLLAYIAAVAKNKRPGVGQTLWAEGCSLVDFLEELTGTAFTATVLDALPDNVHGGPPLREKFQNSWVRFTHFARAADDSAMTSSMARSAFVRGMAGWHSQHAVDICIPILLDKDKPIEEANMSAILVQLKVSAHSTPQSKLSVLAEKIKYFPPPNSSRDAFANSDAPEDVIWAYRNRPYISLVMGLGVVDTSDSAKIPSNVVDFLDKYGKYKLPAASHKREAGSSVSSVHDSTPSARKSRRSKRNPPTVSNPIHPRYSLSYYGCSHKVYRCLPDVKEAKDACKALLQIADVFNDRAKERPIDPILHFKPFWNAGSNCFSWIDEPYLKATAQPEDSGKDEVLAGDVNMADPDNDSAPDDAMDEGP